MCKRNVADHVRLHRQLPVGEVLDQHGLEQRLVGRLDGDERQRPQARAQVGQARRRVRPAGTREVSSIDSLCSRTRLSR